jgi:hypothetical protein
MGWGGGSQLQVDVICKAGLFQLFIPSYLLPVTPSSVSALYHTMLRPILRPAEPRNRTQIHYLHPHYFSHIMPRVPYQRLYALCPLSAVECCCCRVLGLSET